MRAVINRNNSNCRHFKRQIKYEIYQQQKTFKKIQIQHRICTDKAYRLSCIYIKTAFVFYIFSAIKAYYLG